MSVWQRLLGTMRARRRSLAGLDRRHQAVVRAAEQHLGEAELVRFLSATVAGLARIGFSRPERDARMFYQAEAAGAHLLPVHYYSPIPDSGSIPEATWQRPFDFGDSIDLRVEAQLELISELSRWMPELADVPLFEREAAGGFHWLNRWFPPQDARAYYGLLRRYRPRLVVEIGGGYSTMVAARAAVRNGATEVICIEPNPSPALRAGFPGLTTLLASPLQQIPTTLFDRLQEGDVLFVDSSHAGGIGSDVNHIFFTILPRLPAGVLVHFHDIFTPWDYPRSWAKERRLFFTEQYLLQAFLMFNRDYQVLLLNSFLARAHSEPVARHLGPAPSGSDYAAAADVDPALAARRRLRGDPPPASAWLRRRTVATPN